MDIFHEYSYTYRYFEVQRNDRDWITSKWSIYPISRNCTFMCTYEFWLDQISTCCLFLWKPLTHWGRVTHICVGKLTIIGSDNGLSPERRQAIIWTNTGILLIGPLGTNFSEVLIEIQTFSLKKIRLKMSSAKCCSFCLGLNVLINPEVSMSTYRRVLL